ncbi:MAG: hypothetical protein EOR48_33595 [Mesorhizobium sp.]|nr:MAG: hypothetical protein EOR48_33595 [Mesorhizobium sp.]TIP39458.1 MAG: hypothetical protein E5X62_31150 [Mesorhizobium sp.]
MATRYTFVILGRSKERSDAAQTLGSIPLPRSAAAVQNLLMAERGAPLCPAPSLPKLERSAVIDAFTNHQR